MLSQSIFVVMTEEHSWIIYKWEGFVQQRVRGAWEIEGQEAASKEDLLDGQDSAEPHGSAEGARKEP